MSAESTALYACLLPSSKAIAQGASSVDKLVRAILIEVKKSPLVHVVSVTRLSPSAGAWAGALLGLGDRSWGSSVVVYLWTH